MISTDELRAFIKKQTFNKFFVHEMDGNMDFSEAGVDFLEFVNIMFDLETRYGIEIPQKDYDQLTSLNNITKYLNEKPPKKKTAVTKCPQCGKIYDINL